VPKADNEDVSISHGFVRCGVDEGCIHH
jgi:hypothetical protein